MPKQLFILIIADLFVVVHIITCVETPMAVLRYSSSSSVMFLSSSGESLTTHHQATHQESPSTPNT